MLGGKTPFARVLAPSPSQEKAEETVEPPRPAAPERRPSLSLEDRALVCVKESPGVGAREVGTVLDISSAQAQQILRGLVERGKLGLKDDVYWLLSHRAGSAPEDGAPA